MISFDIGGARFNYRVVGIALDGNRVLLHRAEMDDFWSLPGGRGEILEPSEETLKREMMEELSIEIRVDRSVWVVENFFKYKENFATIAQTLLEKGTLPLKSDI
jgi:ADP-ribose pyrophosphatase YjhB (NUDIX family)